MCRVLCGAFPLPSFFSRWYTQAVPLSPSSTLLGVVASLGENLNRASGERLSGGVAAAPASRLPSCAPGLHQLRSAQHGKGGRWQALLCWGCRAASGVCPSSVHVAWWWDQHAEAPGGVPPARHRLQRGTAGTRHGEKSEMLKGKLYSSHPFGLPFLISSFPLHYCGSIWFDGAFLCRRQVPVGRCPVSRSCRSHRAPAGSEVALAVLGSVQARWPGTQSACSLAQAPVTFRQQFCPSLGDDRGVQQALPALDLASPVQRVTLMKSVQRPY